MYMTSQVCLLLDPGQLYLTAFPTLPLARTKHIYHELHKFSKEVYFCAPRLILLSNTQMYSFNPCLKKNNFGGFL